MNNQTFELETRFGYVQVVVTGPENIYVTSPDKGCIVVNTVECRLGLHLGLYGGKWSLLRNKHGREEYHHLTLSKIHFTSHRVVAASDAARRKVLEVIPAAVNDWAAKNPQVFKVQAVAVAQRDYDAAVATVARLEKELAEAKEARDRAGDKLAEAKRAAAAKP
jgi:hypothetical protein